MPKPVARRRAVASGLSSPLELVDRGLVGCGAIADDALEKSFAGGGKWREEHGEVDEVDGAVPLDKHGLRIVLHDLAVVERIGVWLGEAVERDRTRPRFAVAAKLGVALGRRLPFPP